MSIKIRVSVGRKVSSLKGNGAPDFGSYCAGASITFEVDVTLLGMPDAFVNKVRTQYQLCEAAMNEELVRLKAASNGHTSIPTHPADPPPTTPAAAAAVRQPVVTQRRPPAEVAAEMREYESQEEPAEEEEEEDDPPTDGKHLLGWARNQPNDAKTWLIILGKKLRFPNKILDWSQRQVETAYQAYKKEHRSKK